MPGPPVLKPVAGTLRLAVTLAAIAGFLDAHLFQHVTPVFVANHSGNLIKLGMEIGDRRWDEAGISICAIVAFCFGVAAGTLFLYRDEHRVAGRRTGMVLACETAMLAAVVALLIAFDVTESATPDVEHYAVILIAAGAMGLQTAALGRVGTTAVSTTFGTGSLARIGEHAALGSVAPTDARHRHLKTARVLLTVIAAYVAGAVLASALPGQAAIVLVPTSVVAVVATFYLVDPRIAAGLR